MARLYKDESTRLIAVCIAGIDEYSQTTYIDTICRTADEYGFRVLFFTSFSCTCMIDKFITGELNIYHLINYDIIDALILFGETIKDDAVLQYILDAADRAKVPVITVDHAFEGCYNILFDYRQAMEKIVRHIVEEHDFSRIEFIGGMPGNPSSDERRDIFLEVMEQNKKPVQTKQVHYGYFWAGPTEIVMDEICAREKKDMPEAIICANDAMAIVACRRLGEIGYRVPEDVVITGFDGIREAMNHVPTLTTACLDSTKAVERAFEIMDALFGGREVAKDHLIEFKIVYGESCGCSSSEIQRSECNNLVQSLYNKIYDNHFFANHIETMIATVSDHQRIDDAILALHEHIPVLCTEKSWICIVEDYIREIGGLENLLCDQNPDAAYYTSKMKCLLYQHWREFAHNIVFDTVDVLPDLKQHLQEVNKIILTPLHALDRTIGYFAISYNPGQNDFHQLQSYANALGNVLETLRFHEEQQKMIESLEAQSTHDPLTGILNRRGFFAQVDKIFYGSAKTGKKMAIISVDMDGLKKINDNFGHSAGDEAITFMARSLETVCRTDFICSRIGGDEFMISGVVSEDRAQNFERELQAIFDQRNQQAGNRYKVGFSMGMVYAQATEQMQVDEFIRQADAQMYRTKDIHRRQDGYVR